MMRTDGRKDLDRWVVWGGVLGRDGLFRLSRYILVGLGRWSSGYFTAETNELENEVCSPTVNHFLSAISTSCPTSAQPGGRQILKGEQTLGYLGVVNPVTSEEDVPLRGLTSKAYSESKCWTPGNLKGPEVRRDVQFITSSQKSSSDWRREDFLFFTGHGPFAHSLYRFRLIPTPFCACGKEGTPLHYIADCDLTESWHLTKPADNLKYLWFRRVAGNPLLRSKIRQAIQHMHANQDLFKPD
ncbi:hypothetical protein AVEN_129303-1 [Araneus ventricosus]|uniref:Uncharacterized protein n=1 Tax=Araneus ventricosus TaxID=182803 RepID=A0A4Y2MM35_ARAVE|nr:hypothetical protein AVEN_129303-1 [Araneus ventricosus]